MRNPYNLDHHFRRRGPSSSAKATFGIIFVHDCAQHVPHRCLGISLSRTRVYKLCFRRSYDKPTLGIFKGLFRRRGR